MTEYITIPKSEYDSLKLASKIFPELVSQLEKRVKELEDKLNSNSSNTSLPPSISLKKKKLKKKSTGNNIGGQPGHKGTSRHFSDNPSKIENIYPSDYCNCGTKISFNSSNYTRHQKIDLPKIEPFITEYRLHSGYCSCCRKRVRGSLPPNVSKDLLGDNTKTIISVLTGYFKNSRREVKSILSDIFNLDISLGLLSKTEERVSERCSKSYDDLESNLSYSKMVHIDETSNNYKGNKGWTWLFATSLSTLVKWTESRGTNVVKNVFPEFDGIVVSDRYGAYNYFDSDQRQICWAHLLRNFEKFENSSFPSIKKIGIKLKKQGNQLFSFYHSYQNKNLSEYMFLKKAKKIRGQIYSYLLKLETLSESDQIRRIAKNIIKCEGMMWTFFNEPSSIPLTNNHAEQQIRRFVIQRKNSFFVCSERGKRFNERMLSIYQTCQKRKINPFTVLSEIVSGHRELIPQAS